LRSDWQIGRKESRGFDVCLQCAVFDFAAREM
jgi:hypothetical protein